MWFIVPNWGHLVLYFFFLLFVLRSMVLTIFSRQAVNYSSTSSLSSSTKLNSIEKKDKNTNLMRFFFGIYSPPVSTSPFNTASINQIICICWLQIDFISFLVDGSLWNWSESTSDIGQFSQSRFFKNWNHMKCKLYDANRITLTICTSA